MDESESRPRRRTVGWWAAAIAVSLCSALRELRGVAASVLYIAYLKMARRTTRRPDALKTAPPQTDHVGPRIN